MESTNKDREKKRKMLEDLPQVRLNPISIFEFGEIPF
jgi:hypothetical protein